MAVATEEMIRDMAAVVAREVEPQAIILFGSRATGNAGVDSDVDLMVIESAPFGPNNDRRREMTRLWRALAGFSRTQPRYRQSTERGAIPLWRSMMRHARCLLPRPGSRRAPGQVRCGKMKVRR